MKNLPYPWSGIMADPDSVIHAIPLDRLIRFVPD